MQTIQLNNGIEMPLLGYGDYLRRIIAMLPNV